MDKRRVQSLIINKYIDLFKNVKLFSQGSWIPLVENTIWKPRPGAGCGHFHWAVATPKPFQGRELGHSFIYKYMFTIMFTYLSIYIEDHVFTLISPILIQQNRVYSNFLPFMFVAPFSESEKLDFIILNVNTYLIKSPRPAQALTPCFGL